MVGDEFRQIVKGGSWKAMQATMTSLDFTVDIMYIRNQGF